MKLDKNPRGRRWIPYTIAACAAVTLYVALANLNVVWEGIQGIFNFVSPVIWAAVIAYVVDTLVVCYQKLFFKRSKKPRAGRRVCILLAIVSIILLLTLLAVSLVPQLVESITGLISNLTVYAASLGDTLDGVVISVAGHTIDLSEYVEYLDSLIQNVTQAVQQFLQNNVSGIINTSITIGKGFVNGVICCILAVYFLLDKENVKRISKNLLHVWLSEDSYRKTVAFCARCNAILVRYIAFNLLDGLIVGVANYIFMKIVGMPYGVLISVVVGVTNLVPTFGPIAGGVIGAFILVLIRPWYALLFLIFTVILQTLDGYVLKPKMYGETLGVSPLWVLVMLIVGGRMMGMFGVLMSIPFAAISDFIFRDMIWTRLENRKARKIAEAAEKKAAEQGIENAAETPAEAVELEDGELDDPLAAPFEGAKTVSER